MFNMKEAEARRNDSRLAIIVVIILLLITAGLSWYLSVGTLLRDNWVEIAATEYERGDGTEESPYVIGTAAQLAKLALDTNNGVNTEGVYYSLANDITLSGHYWIPIGISHPFAGNFDGHGNSITNYTVDAIRGGQSYGLFGTVTGKVEDLVINDAKVKVRYNGARSTYQPKDRIYVGAFAGRFCGVADDIKVTGEVTVSNAENAVIGSFAGQITEADINYVRTNVTVKNNRNSGKTILGGLSGDVSGNLKLTKTSVRFKTSHEDSEKGGSTECGAIFGNASNLLLNMSNCSFITGFDTDGNDMKFGGFACGYDSLLAGSELKKVFIKACDSDKSKYWALMEPDESDKFADTVLASFGWYTDNTTFYNAVTGEEVAIDSAKEAQNYFKKTMEFGFKRTWKKSGSANYPVLR